MILHIVFYQPKVGATPQDKADLVRHLEVASREIPTIEQVRVGRAVDLGLGYEDWSISLKLEFVAVFEFIDSTQLRSYLQHPAHAKLSELFWKVCDKTMIVDVEAWDPKLPQGLKSLLVK